MLFYCRKNILDVHFIEITSKLKKKKLGLDLWDEKQKKNDGHINL